MTLNRTISKSSDTRVWLQEDGANPGNLLEYQGLMKFNDPSRSSGDVSKIEVPDPNKAGDFIEIDSSQGAEERTSLGIMGRYPRDKNSTLKRLADRRCFFDAQAHIGRCRDPQDQYSSDKVDFYEDLKVTNYSIENYGAISSDETNPTNETAEISSGRWYTRVMRLTFAERATTTVTREIVSIDVCDNGECGDCGSPSDGCSKVFAVMLPSGSTPGTSPTLVFSEDGFQTESTTLIDSLLGNEAPSDSECVGDNFVVISNTDVSLHYADIDEVLLGTESWTQVTTGFVGAPNAIVSLSSRNTWIVGDGGYVYFSSNITGGVTVQDAGVATSQNLADVHAYDSDNVLAVGASNAVVYSRNASSSNATWASVTGPSAGVNLTACWMKGKDVWLVGNAAGNLYYTKNAGVSWTQIGLPITLTIIRDIQFNTKSNGWLAGDISTTNGRVLTTIDGGNDWAVEPIGQGSIPANDQINQIALCEGYSNVGVAYFGGLADDASDGIIIKLS